MIRTAWSIAVQTIFLRVFDTRLLFFTALYRLSRSCHRQEVTIGWDYSGVDHYDLLARPDWTAESILIVSPYVERTFFQTIVKTLKPALLIVVIDDGCRSDEVAMIKSLGSHGTKVRVVLGSARGLVHAKIFHVEWITTGGQRANTLVYGSGNATRQAFDGNVNSELMCKARLTVSNHAEILNWMQHVRTATSDLTGDNVVVPSLRDAKLADGVHIRLPGLTIKDALNKSSNLDLWLQRGRLLSMYRPDASFLRVHVNLLKELPAGALVQMVRDSGFEAPMTKRLSISYLPTIETEEDNDGVVNFLSRFFVWTQLGFWCSDACFSGRSNLFRKAGHETRLRNLHLLNELNDPTLRDEACSRFLDGIDKLWAGFGELAETYLESLNGKVDKDAYRSLFRQRVERDIDLSRDAEFRDRYINGCEVIEIPRFRIDAVAWRSFVESFTRQVHLEWLKAKSQSLIYQYIYAALRDYDLVDEATFDNPKTLEKLLRSNWNTVITGDDGEDITVGDYANGYHKLQ